MRKLYQQIYLTVIASLVLTVIMVSMVWHLSFANRFEVDAFEVAGRLAQVTLPGPDEAQIEQQRAITRLSQSLGFDLTLFDRDRTAIAGWGKPLPAPEAGQTESGWFRDKGQRGWMIALPDGRWLVAGLPRKRGRPIVALVFVLVTIALVVGLSAYPLVRRLTGRLERLEAGVERMGAGDFSTRVKVEGRDEIAALADRFNETAGKIEKLLDAHRQLLAHASHELRTPLTRLRMGLELFKGDVDPKRRAGMEEDIAELDALVDEILLMSRLDNNQARPNETGELDLLALAAEECARIEKCNLEGTSCLITGEARLVRRAIRNLLENARLHGTPPIAIHVGAENGMATVRISDQGKGIPREEWDNVFVPFYRLPGRQGVKGSGLGLPLVRQIAEGHGGRAWIERSEPGHHEVAIAFPLSRTA